MSALTTTPATLNRTTRFQDPTSAQAIHAALPKGVSELVVFDGAGHGIYRDEPERAEAVFRKFLAA